VAIWFSWQLGMTCYSDLMQTFGIRELAERAKRDGACNLAQGTIDSPPPAALADALRKIEVERLSGYDNKRGVMRYRSALQSYLASRGWSAPLEQIIGTAGAMGAMVGALLADCRPGDPVLLPEPFFIGHKLMLEALGFRVVYMSMPLDGPPDWEVFEKEMSKVKAAVFTTPANPTGQMASMDILQKLGEAAAKNDCLLLVDEMYREFIWDNSSIDDSDYDELNFSKTVLLRSFSKTFAIPGWRVGFAVTSSERIEQMAVRHDALYIGGSAIAQHTLAVALGNNLQELNQYVADLRKILQVNMKILAEAFEGYGMDPLPVPATYYMLLKHNRKSDLAAMEELIEKKVVVTPVNILFSDSSKNTGYIRIHFAVAEGVAEKVAGILRK